jgi:hypothetical protein
VSDDGRADRLAAWVALEAAVDGSGVTDVEAAAARGLRGTYVALLDAGFSADQATYLVGVLITRIVDED